MKCESFRQLSDTTKHVCRFGDGAMLFLAFSSSGQGISRTGGRIQNWSRGSRRSQPDFGIVFRYFLNNANPANVSVSVYWEAEFKVIRKKLTKRR